MIYFDRAHKYPKLILNFNEYNIEKSTYERTFWSCAFKKRTKCKARIVTFGSTLKINNGKHNHPPKLKILKDGLKPQAVYIVNVQNK